MAIGLVAGTLFQAAAVAGPAWGANRLRRGVRWWTPEVKSLLREQAPLLLISSFGVVNVSVDQFMAGLLPPGSAAALSFANSLNGVVIQTVVMAASWVLLPELSRLAAEGDREGLKLKIQGSISGIAMVAIPAAIAIFVLGGTAVRVLFQHGKFDSSSTQQVSRIWMGYTCGLLPFALAMVPVRLLNAMRQNQFLVQLGVIAATINAGLDYALMRWLGPVGISLSTSLVYLCSSILIFRFARKLVPGIADGKLWASILRALLVCAPPGAALWMFRQAFSGVMALVVGGLLFAAAIYSVYLWSGLVHVPLKKLRAVAAL